jgi:hypothetical protein
VVERLIETKKMKSRTRRTKDESDLGHSNTTPKGSSMATIISSATRNTFRVQFTMVLTAQRTSMIPTKNGHGDHHT